MNRLRKRFQRMISCEYWRIAYRKRGEGADLLHAGPEDEIEGFSLLPGKRFITQADPFLYRYEGENWLFYERQDLTDMKGTLWCVNLDRPSDPPRLVLEEAFHLSYPQIFEYAGHIYLLPETRGAGDVRLYVCERFPDKWKLAETLFELSAVDTTIFPKGASGGFGAPGALDGENPAYYVFTYTQGRLEIYLCETKRERFCLKRKERIYSSKPSKTLRPGGALLSEGESLYRPAQDCSDYYGQELIVNKIDRLDERGFAEHEYCRLRPSRLKLAHVNAVGLHTYNRSGDYEVIDLLHRERGFWTICKKIEWKLRGNKG